MKEIPILHNWEEFEAKLIELKSKTEQFKSNNNGSQVSHILFRGQTDAKWKLKTTLERYIKKEMSLSDYYRKILVANPQIETFTNENWELPILDKYKEWLQTVTIGASIKPFMAYAYMAYIRHHGFPSPLLDWTKSPYVAAFFAYHNIDKEAKNVSIYTYREYLGQPKLTSSDKLSIVNLGHYVKTHKRHFLQQSQYTICLTLQSSTHYYSNHEKFFSENQYSQDKLDKYNLPVSERINFLKKLDSMNINAFSLFGTKESLMETIALRELQFKD